jgi:hypothetical protein
MSDKIKETEILVAFDDYVPHDPSSPEKTLLRAVLLAALHDSKREGDVGRRARDYLMSPEEKYMFSFLAICNYLDIDPNKLLRTLGMLDRTNRPTADAYRR